MSTVSNFSSYSSTSGIPPKTATQDNQTNSSAEDASAKNSGSNQPVDIVELRYSEFFSQGNNADSGKLTFVKDAQYVSSYDTGVRMSQELIDKIKWPTDNKFYDTYYPGISDAMKLSKSQKNWDENPLSRWDYNTGAEAFQGHDIMQWMTDNTDVRSIMIDGKNRVYGSQPIDEYGYSYKAPADYQARPEQGVGKRLGVIVDEAYFQVLDSGPKVDLTPSAPSTMLDTQDRVGLQGLTLEERKTFLDGVQNILDENNIDLNSRELRYGGGSNAPSWVSGSNGYLDNVMSLIQENKGLMDLMLKSGRVQAGRTTNEATAQEYSIKVTDNQGNKLPSDQIIVASGDGQKQLQMSVEQFKQLDRLAITSMLS
ncbi:MAG: hypothetical protein ACRC2T_07090 [Thermoguttaceae bacterium]